MAAREKLLVIAGDFSGRHIFFYSQRYCFSGRKPRFCMGKMWRKGRLAECLPLPADAVWLPVRWRFFSWWRGWLLLAKCGLRFLFGAGLAAWCLRQRRFLMTVASILMMVIGKLATVTGEQMMAAVRPVTTVMAGGGVGYRQADGAGFGRCRLRGRRGRDLYIRKKLRDTALYC